MNTQCLTTTILTLLLATSISASDETTLEKYLDGSSYDKYLDCGHEGIDDAIKKDPKLLEQRDAKGFTILHIACQRQDKKAVDVLLKAGADPNVLSKTGLSPLHSCCNNMAIAKLLMEKGGKADLRTEHQSSPIQHAAFLGETAFVDQLLQNGASLDLESAVHLARVDRIKELIKADASLVNSKDHKELNPLHVAVYHGHVAVVNILIEHGADVNRSGRWGRDTMTPIILALMMGQSECIKVLIDAGANPHSRFSVRRLGANMTLKDLPNGTQIIKKINDIAAQEIIKNTSEPKDTDKPKE